MTTQQQFQQRFPGAIILPYQGAWPTIADSAFIAAGAVVTGNVTIGEEANIWYGCVLRGDVQSITIGARTNIQDGTVIHVTREIGPTVIGAEVTVGHMALIHAATVHDRAFIGMGSRLLDFSLVEEGGYLAAGAVLTPRKRVPQGELWAGNPAKLLRSVSAKEADWIPKSAAHYVKLASHYKAL
ncbi:MAG: gamma carbonic anhydrase family protein [Alphaproteobacteria bacterium]|nr:gamma carbonic anhydrase family protein [Alphaproteobacteria bacterium]